VYASGRIIVTVGMCVLGLSLARANEGARVRLPATGVTAASLSTQPSPDPATFQRLLGTYRTGRAREAIAALVAWPVDQLAGAAKASTPQFSASDCMAAAILQAEVANALLDVHRLQFGLASRLSPNDVRRVIEVVNSGLLLLHYAGPAPFGEQLGEEPRRSWYYAMASALGASILLQEASSLLEIGLKEFHDDPLLVTARGTIAGRFHHGPRAAMMRLPSTKSAMADYKRALTVAPDLTIAKLRLGQLYVDLGAGREAVDWLQSVSTGASTDDQRYVAHLLLGRVAARAHDLEMAGAEYRKAYSIGAGYQAACVALSRNEVVLEHPERAGDLAQECLLLSEHDDPWPYYDAMGDPDALPHLRAEARGR